MKKKLISTAFLTVTIISVIFFSAPNLSTAQNGTIDDWPMLGHDLQRTSYSTSSAPNSSNLMWIFNTTASEVVTCPAVDDGKVIFSASNGNVYALNSNTLTPLTYIL